MNQYKKQGFNESDDNLWHTSTQNNNISEFIVDNFSETSTPSQTKQPFPRNFTMQYSPEKPIDDFQRSKTKSSGRKKINLFVYSSNEDAAGGDLNENGLREMLCKMVEENQRNSAKIEQMLQMIVGKGRMSLKQKNQKMRARNIARGKEDKNDKWVEMTSEGDVDLMFETQGNQKMDFSRKGNKRRSREKVGNPFSQIKRNRPQNSEIQKGPHPRVTDKLKMRPDKLFRKKQDKRTHTANKINKNYSKKISKTNSGSKAKHSRPTPSQKNLKMFNQKELFLTLQPSDTSPNRVDSSPKRIATFEVDFKHKIFSISDSDRFQKKTSNETLKSSNGEIDLMDSESEERKTIRKEQEKAILSKRVLPMNSKFTSNDQNVWSFARNRVSGPEPVMEAGNESDGKSRRISRKKGRDGSNVESKAQRSTTENNDIGQRKEIKKFKEENKILKMRIKELEKSTNEKRNIRENQEKTTNRLEESIKRLEIQIKKLDDAKQTFENYKKQVEKNIQSLKEQNQQLLNENNRLKGVSSAYIEIQKANETPRDNQASTTFERFQKKLRNNLSGDLFQKGFFSQDKEKKQDNNWFKIRDQDQRVCASMFKNKVQGDEPSKMQKRPNLPKKKVKLVVPKRNNLLNKSNSKFAPKANENETFNIYKHSSEKENEDIFEIYGRKEHNESLRSFTNSAKKADKIKKRKKKTKKMLLMSMYSDDEENEEHARKSKKISTKRKKIDGQYRQGQEREYQSHVRYSERPLKKFSRTKRRNEEQYEFPVVYLKNGDLRNGVFTKEMIHDRENSQNSFKSNQIPRLGTQRNPKKINIFETKKNNKLAPHLIYNDSKETLNSSCNQSIKVIDSSLCKSNKKQKIKYTNQRKLRIKTNPMEFKQEKDFFDQGYHSNVHNADNKILNLMQLNGMFNTSEIRKSKRTRLPPKRVRLKKLNKTNVINASNLSTQGLKIMQPKRNKNDGEIIIEKNKKNLNDSKLKVFGRASFSGNIRRKKKRATLLKHEHNSSNPSSIVKSSFKKVSRRKGDGHLKTRLKNKGKLLMLKGSEEFDSYDDIILSEAASHRLVDKS